MAITIFFQHFIVYDDDRIKPEWFAIANQKLELILPKMEDENREYVDPNCEIDSQSGEKDLRGNGALFQIDSSRFEENRSRHPDMDSKYSEINSIKEISESPLDQNSQNDTKAMDDSLSFHENSASNHHISQNCFPCQDRYDTDMVNRSVSDNSFCETESQDQTNKYLNDKALSSEIPNLGGELIPFVSFNASSQHECCDSLPNPRLSAEKIDRRDTNSNYKSFDSLSSSNKKSKEKLKQPQDQALQKRGSAQLKENGPQKSLSCELQGSHMCEYCERAIEVSKELAQEIEKDTKNLALQRNVPLELSFCRCGACFTWYHTYCIDPPLPQSPFVSNRHWICGDCKCCRSCGSPSPGTMPDTKWSVRTVFGFSCILCSKCVKGFDKRQYCPVCAKLWSIPSKPVPTRKKSKKLSSNAETLCQKSESQEQIPATQNLSSQPSTQLANLSANFEKEVGEVEGHRLCSIDNIIENKSDSGAHQSSINVGLVEHTLQDSLDMQDVESNTIHMDEQISQPIDTKIQQDNPEFEQKNSIQKEQENELPTLLESHEIQCSSTIITNPHITNVDIPQTDQTQNIENESAMDTSGCLLSHDMQDSPKLDDCMICCDQCNLWVHAECDNISPEQYIEYERNESVIYTCPACRQDQMLNMLDHLAK